LVLVSTRSALILCVCDSTTQGARLTGLSLLPRRPRDGAVPWSLARDVGARRIWLIVHVGSGCGVLLIRFSSDRIGVRSTLVTRSRTRSRASVCSSDSKIACITRHRLVRRAESRAALRVVRTTEAVTSEMISDSRGFMQQKQGLTNWSINQPAHGEDAAQSQCAVSLRSLRLSRRSSRRA